MTESPNPSAFPPLSRRTLLKLFGIGTLGGLLSYSRIAKPQPTVHEQDSLTLPRSLDRPRSAVVVGGGLAGLSAAYELSQRGFTVTMLERSPQLGGKIASWPIEVNGESFITEHGFHGFFPQYYNLWGLVDELSIRQNFTELPTYAVLYKDQYDPEIFKPRRSAFPWNVVDLAVGSPNNLRWGLNLTKWEHWDVLKNIAGFDPEKSYQRLDHLAVADWAAEDFPRGLYEVYFLPFAKSSLNAPDMLSVAEMTQFFHFYFFGNPEGLAFRGTCQDMGRSLVDPIAAAITATGGEIITEATLTGLDWQDGKIAGLRYQQGGSGTTAPFWVDRNPLLSTDAVEYFGAGDAVYVLDGPRQEALSLTCTHQGCTVQPQGEQGYLCPCHGALYDGSGQVQGGPAPRNLSRFQVLDRQGDRLQLVALDPPENLAEIPLEADYYVMAADVVGMRNIFALSAGSANPTVLNQVDQLAVSDPFATVRFWFDRDFPWDYSDFTSLSGYRLTDSITLYHHIQDDYKAWADRTGGSVVELHSYCYKEAEFPTQADLLATFEQELYEIVPELAGANCFHRQLVNQKNFSGFPPGSDADRPCTDSGVSNLLFAGDWVKMPFACGLMERAVSSGFLAANAICQREGLQRRSLLSVNPVGLLAPLTSAEPETL
ncbi:MAG: FAD-dependent oxidoreductase [Prochlorothrix sp.]|nr:FAD-dependent oxidoreductase [Prochlorothrix sp.]